MDDEARERQRVYQRDYMRQRRAADPEKYREQLREWRTVNREQRLEHDRQLRLADPVGTAAKTAASNANQRAKRLGLSGRLTTADIRALWERQPVCVGCGKGRGVDHVIDMRSAGGENVPANLQNLCFECNSAKEVVRKKSAPACVNGHELSGDNLYIVPGTGGRACRACTYARNIVQRRKAGIPARY